MKRLFNRRNQLGQVNNSVLGAVVLLIVVVLIVLFITGRI
jgi:hypothetical protein